MAKHDTTKIVNKVIYQGDTLIDLSSDTVTVSDVLYPAYFHLPTGERVQGSCNYDANTSDATASASEVLSGKTFYKNGEKLTGSMSNRGGQASDISTVAQEVTITQGYHDGSGKVKINATERAKLIASNIKTGVEILGVTGTYDGTELIKATVGSATPSWEVQTILPSSKGEYDYFTQFTVNAIPYVETINSAGGYTVTIG